MSKKNKGGLVYSTNPDYKLEKEKETGETLPPDQQNLLVKRESKGRGGKVVTIVCDFTGNGEDLKELAKLLKTHCGVGGTVKNGEVVIQGEFRQKIAELLKSKGYRVKVAG